jgi:glutamine synthetase
VTPREEDSMSRQIDDAILGADGASETSDADRLAALRDSGVDTLVIGAPDINCEFRSKRFALNLFTREEVEIAFSDYLFSADIVEELMRPRPGYQGYFPTESTGLPDVFVRPDWNLLRVLPWDPKTALVLGDFYTHHGDEMPISPRGVLRRVVERLRGLGYEPMAGSEYEFMVFRTDPVTARRQATDLTPLSEGPAYGNTRAAVDELVLGDVRRQLDAAGIPVEAANAEAMAGQNEITIRYSDAMTAADNAFLYKHFVRELLARQGMTASFIAKYDPAGYGSSGHLHMSLRHGSADGAPALVDDAGALSETAGHAIAGFLATLQDFTAFYAPFVNSYRRYQMDHSWAGDTVSWGLDNRSCSLRVLHTTPGSTRIESRVPGADMNPYIALAASLAGFGHGIEQGLEPPPRIEGDAYAEEGIQKIPNDLYKAVELLDNSALARDWLGEEFVNFYAETRFWDAEQHRLALTPWELRRYL